ncbi:IclR family transcriptional regulator [Nesterenkonia sp. PF2B19]|uniref:IclR family transcriptional regulator n=1 Tax=Nesterenkonia sp. PF2B19 TaxID=1881858 RepID=UPI000A19BF48|nr:IclR family transcriptional regulator C-terminal domain-containing protein [Nesterenkonia sp. PF2B19]OSM44506.1 hypothetical protein BCY76_002095 [Nesterenkonia sp. PF2B19]
MVVDRHVLPGSSDPTRRLMVILDRLVSRFPGQGWGVRELAEEMGASRTTVNRALQALADLSLVRAEGGGTYAVGPRLRVIAGMAHRSHGVLREGPAVLAELTRDTGATAMAVMQGPRPTEAFVAAVHQAPGGIQYRLAPGMGLPLHAGAAGQAILSELDPAVLAQIAPERFTEATHVDVAELRQILDEAGARGYVTSIGQHIPLAAGVAAPFRTPDGQIGAVSATRPRTETSTTDLEAIAAQVIAAAQALGSSAVTTPVAPSAEPPTPRDGASSAAGRVERLMTLLAAGAPGLGSPTAAARSLQAHSATAKKLLASAADCGLLRYAEPSNTAACGSLLLRWAAQLGPRPGLGDLLRPRLRELSADTGETTALVVLAPEERTATIAEVVDGPNPVRYGVVTGAEVPLHAGASGKALLAHLPTSTAEQLDLPRLAPGTLVTRDALREDLAAIRDRGWAVGEGERFSDAFGLAAPVFEGAPWWRRSRSRSRGSGRTRSTSTRWSQRCVAPPRRPPS